VGEGSAAGFNSYEEAGDERVDENATLTRWDKGKELCAGGESQKDDGPLPEREATSGALAFRT